MIISLNQGYLPIKPLKERELTAKVSGPLATIAQKTDVVEAELALASVIDIGTGPASPHPVYPVGTKVYLVPDAALQNWNKVVLELNGVKFVRAPLHVVLAVNLEQGEHL